ncbi:MAG: IS21 family transposase [Candidatus Thiodiazotropha sp. (ex Dulcina madagascariensis)]|nr:IS21 family transposase [Candidatus Thiodiazotropha sp. (ex Dulcina madagascariensis)]MCU7929148.1 IS21 family transposase [Candidatus Thiodiazotropha sp. (ex Dulcina madagascariensis)]
MYELRQILVRMRLGDSDRALAKAGLIGRPKAKALRQLAEAEGWLDLNRPLPEDTVLAEALPQARKRSSSISSVEPFRDKVEQWAAHDIPCRAIYQALKREHQYAGSYSSVYRFAQSVKPSQPKATMPLDFAIGEAAQIDFGSGPELVDPETGEIVKTHFFLMTLCWSRHQYAEIVLDQKVPTWLECHRHAFEWFGGVPARVIIDNAKCAITRACARDPVVQRAYAECAEGYGFKIDALPPREPQKKGRVESGIKYLKTNFLPLRGFRSLADANRQLQDWILEEAGNRIHGSTHEKPLLRFAIEQPLLKPLPAVVPEFAEWAKVKVHCDCHVQFEKCLYSVPFKLISQTIWLKATPVTVRIYRDHELVAVHPRLHRPGARSTQDDHLPPEAIAWKMRDPQWCLQQSEKVGASCHRLIRTLFADRVLDNLRAAQGVIRLKDKYGSARLEAACQRALSYNNPRYGTVKTILAKGLEQHPSAEQAFDTLADSYTGQGRFCRDTHNLLKH